MFIFISGAERFFLECLARQEVSGTISGTRAIYDLEVALGEERQPATREGVDVLHHEGLPERLMVRDEFEWVGGEKVDAKLREGQRLVLALHARTHGS